MVAILQASLREFIQLVKDDPSQKEDLEHDYNAFRMITAAVIGKVADLILSDKWQSLCGTMNQPVQYNQEVQPDFRFRLSDIVI